MNVRTVVANLDPVSAGQQVARGVPEEPIWRAVRVAADLAARRGRRVRGDAMGLEAESVHATSMSADVHHVDLAVARGTIEVGGDGLAALGKTAIVVAKAAQWHTRWQVARVLGEQRDKRTDRRRDARTDVQPGLRPSRPFRAGPSRGRRSARR